MWITFLYIYYFAYLCTKFVDNFLWITTTKKPEYACFSAVIHSHVATYGGNTVFNALTFLCRVYIMYIWI